jgi:hypothetical protein
VKRIERKPAVASQSDELVAEAISIMDKCRARDLEQGRPVITQKSYVRKRRKLQEAWETGFGALRKGSDPPIDTKDARFIEHMAKIAAARIAEGSKHLKSNIATAARIRRDPKYLERYRRDPQRYAVKPHKGSAGRAGVQDAATTTKRKRDRLDAVKQMLKANPKLKPADLVAKFGYSSKTAGLDLKTAKK